MRKWKASLMLCTVLLLASCLWNRSNSSFSGPIPVPRDVTSPGELSADLAITRIVWGEYVFLNGTDAMPSVPLPEDASEATLSSSGRYVAYHTGFVLNDQIEWLDLETGEHRVLARELDFTPAAMSVSYPTFTPDEQSIVFQVGWSDATKVASVDLASGDIQVIDAPGAMNTFPEVSPDGRWVLVSCEGGESGGLWALCLIDREARTRTYLADDEGFDPMFGGLFTPDGQWVVYYTSDASLSGGGRVYRVGIGGEDKLLLASGLRPSGVMLAATAQEAVFPCRYPDRPACDWVCVVNLDGTDPRRLTYLGERCVDMNAP